MVVEPRTMSMKRKGFRNWRVKRFVLSIPILEIVGKETKAFLCFLIFFSLISRRMFRRVGFGVCLRFLYATHLSLVTLFSCVNILRVFSSDHCHELPNPRLFIDVL